MGWLSNFFSGVDDVAHQAAGALDDLAHLDFSGFEDRVTNNLFNIMENSSLRSVAMPLLDAFTFGLGSSVAQAEYNKKKYGEHNINGSEVAKNMAANYAVNTGANMAGYSPTYATSASDVAYNTALGAGKGAAVAGITGNSVSEGAKSGAIGAGITSAGDYIGSNMSEPKQSQAPWANNTAEFKSNYLDQPQPEQSYAPWANGMGGSGTSQMPQQEQNPFFSGMKSAFNTAQNYFNQMGPRSIGNWGEGLLGMYQGYKQRQTARDLLSALGGRRDAYSTQLQRNLAARDAASGRRSNFGGRNVELLAKLAELDSHNAPMYQNLQMAQIGGLGSILQSGLRLGQKEGWFRDPYTPMSQPSWSMPSFPTINEPTAMLDTGNIPELSRRRPPPAY